MQQCPKCGNDLEEWETWFECSCGDMVGSCCWDFAYGCCDECASDDEDEDEY